MVFSIGIALIFLDLKNLLLYVLNDLVRRTFPRVYDMSTIIGKFLPHIANQ